MSPLLRRFLQVSVALIVILALVAGGFYLWRRSQALDPGALMDMQTFHCLAVGESMRTIGYTRAQRKEKQLKRIDRLLREELDELDAAKLRSERAILAWEIADARFQRGCAEAYFAPGSTKVRQDFEQPPAAMDTTLLEESFQSALEKTTPRLRPHGFDERAALHLSSLALQQGQARLALTRAQEHLEAQPEGLYADALRLVVADAQLSLGNQDEALLIYQEVGRLPIGLEAHYARYREAMIQEKLGQEDKHQALLEDVVKWARRGDRTALRLVLEGQTLPLPPRDP
jgi:hypothetical protein